MLESDLGKIQVYTGYGKGKTTASLGLAIRAIGRNKRVAIIFFDKGGDNYGERKVLDGLVSKNFQYHVTGRERFNDKNKKFHFGIESVDKEQAQKGLKIMADLLNEALIDLLILDEINSAIHLEMLDLEAFLTVLDQKPKYIEIVLTGREVHPRILARADLVTEMKLIKHYYDKGVEAREGIEY